MIFFSILFSLLSLSLCSCMYCNPEPLNFCFAAMNRRVLLQAILANREEKKKNTGSSSKPRCCHRDLNGCCSGSSTFFYSELNGVFTLMRTLRNSEGFLGGKDVFHFTPCRLWQVFSETTLAHHGFCAVMSNLSTLATKCC